MWPNCSRNFFDGFFLRLGILPRSMMTSYSYVLPSIRLEQKEIFRSAYVSSLHAALQAPFFDVIALKADQHCSTSLLPQCGQGTSPSS